MELFFEEFLWWVPGLISGVPSVLFNIATYVLGAYAIYTVARRRCLRKPWLAWIPVVNCFLLGSLSDQYRYVVKGENKSKRKTLLILRICTVVMSALIVVMSVAAVAPLLFADDWTGNSFTATMTISLLMSAIPFAGVSIAYTVVRYMALYDLLKSMDPDNAVLFLVLSILFHPTEAFFLFFNREKDLGMPPRRQEPVYAEPIVEEDNTEYL